MVTGGGGGAGAGPLAGERGRQYAGAPPSSGLASVLGPRVHAQQWHIGDPLSRAEAV